jgi:transposase
MMITIGVDAHKREHVAVILDEAGRELDRWRGPNSAEGWLNMLGWASNLGSVRRWGVEGAWNYGRGLSQHLVGAGEEVYEIKPRWTAEVRKRLRKRGKSDRLDARAVAELVWREGSDLPAVVEEDETAVLDLLVSEREDLLAEATRLRNRIHQLLLQLDPEYKAHLPKLNSEAGLRALEGYAASGNEPREQRAAAIRRLARRLRLATEQAEELARRIRSLARKGFHPLTRLCGINLLTAGALAGILGPPTSRRFSNDAQLAAYAGVAPLEASSAGDIRHRLSRDGNRELNAIIYWIAIAQARWSPEARAYLRRRISEGKTTREALRALKRYIVRAIWRLWRECRTVESTATDSEVAAPFT